MAASRGWVGPPIIWRIAKTFQNLIAGNLKLEYHFEYAEAYSKSRILNMGWLSYSGLWLWLANIQKPYSINVTDSTVVSESGVGDTIGIGPESRYQRAWYRYRNRILHIPGSQYRSRYRIFLFLGTPLNKLGHFFIFYLITFAKSWYQYRNRYRILPIPGSRNRYRNRPELFLVSVS